MSLIDARNIEIRDDNTDRTLVSDVSFTIGAGERLGVIGESGSGKSLTSLAVLGLLPANLQASGSVLIEREDQEPVDAVTARSRELDTVRGKTLSAVFQEPLTALDPLMRVGKQLAWPLRHHQGLRGDALRKGVLQALSDVQLPNPERIANSYVYEISGGQRQRVAIAIALASTPRLLIADEPTTALDVTVQAGVLDLLNDAVTQRGMALMFISHDLPVVASITDRILVMQHGEQREIGTTQQVLRNPQEPYTQTLVAASRELDNFLPKGTS